MTKFQTLKTSLIKTAVISALILGVLGGGAYVVSGMSKQASDEKRKLESSINATRAQIQTYETQLNRAGDSTKVYVDILKVRDGNKIFFLTREELLSQLQELTQKYRLNVTSSEIGPLTPRTEPAFSGIEMDFHTADIELEFEAITDQHVYSFMDELGRLFPGFITFNSVEMSRLRDLDENTMLQIRSGGVPFLVRAGFSANWTTIRPKPPQEAQ